ncbi:hypothetical protein Hanom_Chr07g00630941 [Helianthus anomalus]
MCSRGFFFFFLNGQRILQNGLLANITTSGYTCLRTGENPHLGPKPVNTRSKARQCDEVKPAQFKDRTSDLHICA